MLYWHSHGVWILFLFFYFLYNENGDRTVLDELWSKHLTLIKLTLVKSLWSSYLHFFFCFRWHCNEIIENFFLDIGGYNVLCPKIFKKRMLMIIRLYVLKLFSTSNSPKGIRSLYFFEVEFFWGEQLIRIYRSTLSF